MAGMAIFLSAPLEYWLAFDPKGQQAYLTGIDKQMTGASGQFSSGLVEIRYLARAGGLSTVGENEAK